MTRPESSGSTWLLSQMTAERETVVRPAASEGASIQKLLTRKDRGRPPGARSGPHLTRSRKDPGVRQTEGDQMRKKIRLWAAWSGIPFMVRFFIDSCSSPTGSPAQSSLPADKIAAHTRTTGRHPVGWRCVPRRHVLPQLGARSRATRTDRRGGDLAVLSPIVSVAASVIILIVPIMLWWRPPSGRPSRRPRPLAQRRGTIIFVIGFVRTSLGRRGRVSHLRDTSADPLYPGGRGTSASSPLRWQFGVHGSPSSTTTVIMERAVLLVDSAVRFLRLARRHDRAHDPGDQA